MTNKHTQAGPAGIDVGELAFTETGELLGLSDLDLDTVAGGLADTNYNCICGEPNREC